MSLRITRPTLVVMLVVTAALGACSNPTAPTRNMTPSVRSLEVIADPPTCKDGGWAGSSGRC